MNVISFIRSCYFTQLNKIYRCISSVETHICALFQESCVRVMFGFLATNSGQSVSDYPK